MHHDKPKILLLDHISITNDIISLNKYQHINTSYNLILQDFYKSLKTNDLHNILFKYIDLLIQLFHQDNIELILTFIINLCTISEPNSFTFTDITITTDILDNSILSLIKQAYNMAGNMDSHFDNLALEILQKLNINENNMIYYKQKLNVYFNHDRVQIPTSNSPEPEQAESSDDIITKIKTCENNKHETNTTIDEYKTAAYNLDEEMKELSKSIEGMPLTINTNYIELYDACEKFKTVIKDAQPYDDLADLIDAIFDNAYNLGILKFRNNSKLQYEIDMEEHLVTRLIYALQNALGDDYDMPKFRPIWVLMNTCIAATYKLESTNHNILQITKKLEFIKYNLDIAQKKKVAIKQLIKIYTDMLQATPVDSSKLLKNLVPIYIGQSQSKLVKLSDYKQTNDYDEQALTVIHTNIKKFKKEINEIYRNNLSIRKYLLLMSYTSLVNREIFLDKKVTVMTDELNTLESTFTYDDMTNYNDAKNIVDSLISHNHLYLRALTNLNNVKNKSNEYSDENSDDNSDEINEEITELKKICDGESTLIKQLLVLFNKNILKKDTKKKLYNLYTYTIDLDKSRSSRIVITEKIRRIEEIITTQDPYVNQNDQDTFTKLFKEITIIKNKLKLAKLVATCAKNNESLVSITSSGGAPLGKVYINKSNKYWASTFLKDFIKMSGRHFRGGGKHVTFMNEESDGTSEDPLQGDKIEGVHKGTSKSKGVKTEETVWPDPSWEEPDPSWAPPIGGPDSSWAPPIGGPDSSWAPPLGGPDSSWAPPIGGPDPATGWSPDAIKTIIDSENLDVKVVPNSTRSPIYCIYLHPEMEYALNGINIDLGIPNMSLMTTKYENKILNLLNATRQVTPIRKFIITDNKNENISHILIALRKLNFIIPIIPTTYNTGRNTFPYSNYEITKMTELLIPSLSTTVQCLLKIILHNIITDTSTSNINTLWNTILDNADWPLTLQNDLKNTNCLIILLILEIFGFKKMYGNISNQIRVYETAEQWASGSLGELLNITDTSIIEKIKGNKELLQFLNIIRVHCSPRFLNSEEQWDKYINANSYKKKSPFTGGSQINSINYNKFFTHNLYNINNHLQLFKSMIQSGGALINPIKENHIINSLTKLVNELANTNTKRDMGIHDDVFAQAKADLAMCNELYNKIVKIIEFWNTVLVTVDKSTNNENKNMFKNEIQGDLNNFIPTTDNIDSARAKLQGKLEKYLSQFTNKVEDMRKKILLVLYPSTYNSFKL